jgi:NADH:ubiquinone oxidoreductase subunit H
MIATGIVIASVIIVFIALSVMAFILAERKVSAWIQDRLGPRRVGKFGWAQSIADTIKLVSKEDTIPKGADRLLFRMAPYLAFCASFVGFCCPSARSGRLRTPGLGLFMLAVCRAKCSCDPRGSRRPASRLRQHP